MLAGASPGIALLNNKHRLGRVTMVYFYDGNVPSCSCRQPDAVIAQSQHQIKYSSPVAVRVTSRIVIWLIKESLTGLPVQETAVSRDRI